MTKAALLAATSLSVALLASAGAWAQNAQEGPSNAKLLERIEQLEAELKAMKDLVGEHDEAVASSTEEAKKVARSTVKAAIPRLPDTVWHLAGYADAGVIVGDKTSPGSFNAGTFNPAFHFQYRDFILFEGEAEITINNEGETDFELEYTQLDILLHDNATLVVGKYLSPIGQFGERLHPSWINRSVNAPAGFGHDGIQPGTDVGVQLRGGVPLGATTFTYALAVGNGPRLGHEGNVMLEGYGGDDNKNKSIGGRLGFLPVPYFELGVSYLNASVDGDDMDGTVAATSGDFKLWGLDGAFTKGSWDVRFEYLNGKRDSLFSFDDEEGALALLPQMKQVAWYAQAAYRLSGITKNAILKNFEPVVRYGKYSIAGNEELEEENAEKRFNIGLNYWLAPSIVAKAGIERRNFIVEDIPNDTRYLFQIAYGY
ncbi:MAG: hypothetical protein ACOY99_09605 [Pseudomonadota bacterium]